MASGGLWIGRSRRPLLRAAIISLLTLCLILVLGEGGLLGKLAPSPGLDATSGASTVQVPDQPESQSTPSPSVPATPHRFAVPVPPPLLHTVYWGAYRGGAPYDRSQVADLVQQAGATPALLAWYQSWDTSPPFSVGDAAWLQSLGIVPLVNWEPWVPPSSVTVLKVDQPTYRLANIASGAFDDYVRAYAAGIRSYGGPIFLAPIHEMNGFWYPWGGTVNGNSPADFIAAWRHLHDLFQEEGATNVTWVWSVNNLSVPATAANSISSYWPGTDYVDWVGVSGYNWGRASQYSIWTSFDGVFANALSQLRGFGKPIMLTETSSVEVGGDKSSWIKDAFSSMQLHPEIAAFVWYDQRDPGQRDWRIDSSTSARSVFEESVVEPWVLSAPDAVKAALTAIPKPPMRSQ
jgi:mannan endo-1,4-beta-mannosidase